MTYDLTAAVKRLRQMLPLCDTRQWQEDVRLVLSALEAAQAAMPPREPTQAMDDAASTVDRSNLPGMFRREVWRRMYDAWTQEQTSGAGAYAGEVSPASVPLDHQSAATPSTLAGGPSQEGADGPAADPIADLCMQIRAFLADAPKEMPHEGYRYGELLSFAADALEAAQADAARYRWLRGGAPGHSERWSRWNLQRWDGSSWHSLERTALDAAIDTAMKGEGDGATAAPSEATASVTDPAADPLPVAWATPSLLVTMSAVEKRRLTSPEMRGRGGEWEADARDADRYSVPLYRAAALDRLRAERDELRAMLQGTNRDAARLATLVDKYKWQVRDTCARAERAEAERDTLLAIVRAADELREWLHPDRDSPDKLIWVCQDYDAARAAWKGEV